MIIYIDENMSPYLSRGFNFLQMPENAKLSDSVEIRSIRDDYGVGALDEDWIPDAGSKDSCIITQDFNIHRISHQKTLCEQFKLGMFYFRPPSKNGFLYWDMVKLMVKHWPEIIKVVSKQKRPFSYKITSRSGLESL